jgi:[ribosomal protein S18]-alanine N-acetyltransferase
MTLFSRSAFSIRSATVADCDDLSEIHANSFSRGWSGAEFESLLVQPRTHALIAHRRNRLRRSSAAGFILYRVVTDEAEILTVAVAQESRRRGIGRALLEEALRHAYRDGAERIYLEVEDTNRAAIALYRWAEFQETGRRAGYYMEGRTTPGGALVMLRQLR